uniref:Alpha-mannosidase n=1 Tax=Kalanchoe fedtschenkoi TaxID=63787 RepID=A0A7N0ZZ82_KALFE
MAFSSYIGYPRRSGGGGWPRVLLPSSTPKPSSSSSSKLPRKLRKRALFKDFISANFFTIGLAISVLFFLFVVFRYGVPRPITTARFTPRYSRKSASHRKPFFNGTRLGAAVDVTTKDLYDQIEFLDVDGGAWKQGWPVGYKGNEWDSEKLKIFVVPHSHNDPGWKLTVDEYYEKQSRHILDTIVDTLSKDARRKFIWEEMSYLEKWWRDATDAKKEALISLVQNGQLEIVGGGWVMNDEANSHYYAIIEQITEGNMWLNDTIGVVPKNSWAIDPFGYSPTMAYLLRRMGFENMLIQRTHYELKKELAKKKKLEYVWRQSWDADETTDIFVHMMPFYSYDIPHTCGPEPAICCQFDFARMRGFMYELCPWHVDPVETTQDNVQERALLLLDQYRKKSTLYRTNTLLIPLGDDFRYISIDEAEAQFRNYQLLFDHINSNPSLNAEAKFGTLDDYFRTLREEADRVNYSLTGETGSDQIAGFPSLSGDFFTYADRQQDYWSGYYVSRPFFKAVDRVLEQTLRATEMLMALLLGSCQRSQCEKLPLSFSYKLTAARRNLALFQHHDGVTGTAKDHVVRDYGTRMHTSLQDLQIFMSKAIEALFGIRHEKSDHTPSQFDPIQARSKYDAQPVYRAMSARDGSIQSVVFFNPLEQARNEIVMVMVSRPDVAVLDSNWTCVKSQISPELQHSKNNVFTGRHRLFWKVSVPPMGLVTYYVANGYAACEKAEPAKLRFSSGSDPLTCLTPYACSKVEGDTVQISNQRLTLTFDASCGLLNKATHKDGSVNTLGEEIAIYASSGSGAYLFKPNGDAESIIRAGGQLVVSEGSLVQEVVSYPNAAGETTPVSHSTRIYNVDQSVQEMIIEKEYHVELLGDEFNNKELIARYKTDIDNRRIFYSDLNGFQMSRRETYDKIPLQGNYYPMPSLAFMQGSDGRRFSVHSRQSLGVAGLKDGWLEIMLDRRLLRDDGRGLGQGVTDNRPINVVFHILLESNVSSPSSTPASNSFPLHPSLLSHLVGKGLNYPLLGFIAKKPQEISVQPPARFFYPLAAPLPCDLHIVNLKVPQPLKYSQQPIEDSRFVLVLQRQKWDPSYSHDGCKTTSEEPANLFTMFKGMAASNVKPTSLNLLHEDAELLGYPEQAGEIGKDGRVNLSPMEIQAYKLELRPRQ